MGSDLSSLTALQGGADASSDNSARGTDRSPDCDHESSDTRANDESCTNEGSDNGTSCCTRTSSSTDNFGTKRSWANEGSAIREADADTDNGPWPLLRSRWYLRSVWAW